MTKTTNGLEITATPAKNAPKNTSTPAAPVTTFDIRDDASAPVVRATSLSEISVGESIIGTLQSFQGIPAINGKPVCRIFVHCYEFDLRFSALLDGTLADNISLKGQDVTLTFRGINIVKGTRYPKFSVVMGG